MKMLVFIDFEFVLSYKVKKKIEIEILLKDNSVLKNMKDSGAGRDGISLKSFPPFDNPLQTTHI
jgi:hypothetical protein